MAKYKVTVEGQGEFVVEVPDGSPPPTPEQVWKQLQTGTRQPAAPAAPAPPAQPERGLMEQFKDIDRSLGQGFAFGFGDEISAGLGAAYDKLTGQPFGESYDRRLKEERAGLDRARQEHPFLSTAATIGGAVANPAFLPARGKTLAQTAINAIKAGSKGGFLSGVGGSEGGVQNRLVGGAIGAGIGAGVGGAIPVVGATIRGGTQRLADALADTPVGAALGSFPGVTLPGQARGNQKILEALQRDGMSLADAEARIAELARSGKPINLADAGGENIRGLADASMIPPTQARAGAAQQLVERSGNAGGRISDDLAKATGLNGDVLMVSEALVAKRAAESKPLYEAAYQAGAGGIQNEQVLGILRLPHFRQAFNRAKRIAALEGRKLPDILDEQGNLKQIPDLQTLDYVKRGLDDHLFTGRISGSLGKAEERALKQVRAQFLATLDEAVPEYAQARAAFAGPTQLIEAAQAGTKFTTLSPQEIQRSLATEFNTPAEREHFLLGAVDTIRKAISGSPDGSDVYKRVFGNVTKREQLRALFPSPEKFAEFEQAMAAEKQMRITADAVRGNSRTASRQFALDDLGFDPVTPMARAVTGDWKGAVGQAASSRLHGVVGANAEAIVPQLFGDPRQALSVLRKAEEALQQKAKTPVRAPAAVGNLGGLLGSGVFR